MTTEKLIFQIKKKRSFLSIGLDVDLEKIPPFFLKNKEPIFEFNKQIIDKTHHLTVAYKLNVAFYESYGLEGWHALDRTIHYLNESYPEIFTIADAKRGDIENSSKKYAASFFENLNFDAITVSPYMGKDSIMPFLNYEDKFTIILILTSNPSGIGGFQGKKLKTDIPLYQEILKDCLTWKHNHRMMFVVGATNGEHLSSIRRIAPNHFFLVPGIGFQGGTVDEVCKYGLHEDHVGLLINASRSILYAKKHEHFDEAAREETFKIQSQMDRILKERNIC